MKGLQGGRQPNADIYKKRAAAVFTPPPDRIQTRLFTMENSRNYYGYNTSRDSQGSQGDDGRFWSQAYLTGMAFVQGTDLDLFGTPVGPVADYGIGMRPSTDSVFYTLNDPCYTSDQNPDQSLQSWTLLALRHLAPHPATPNGYGRSPRSGPSHSSYNRHNPYPPPLSRGVLFRWHLPYDLSDIPYSSGDRSFTVFRRRHSASFGVCNLPVSGSCCGAKDCGHR